MYALTLWRPWPWVILHSKRPKRVENREWIPPTNMLRVGERFAFHAGKTFDEDAAEHLRIAGIDVPEDNPRDHPAGMLVCTARLIALFQHGAGSGEIAPILVGSLAENGLTAEGKAAIDGLVEDMFFSGPYGWVFDLVRVVTPPIPCRGNRKLWDLPIDAERALKEIGRQVDL